MRVERRGHDKERFVLGVFEEIADVYDPMNRLLTFGMWDRWQRRVAAVAAPQPGESWLDVACGTGDLTVGLARRVGPGGSIVGLDMSASMLAVARNKMAALGMAERVRLVEGNALEMPFPTESFDGATIGFALRNVRDIVGALREMRRVVRPGGRVISLEVSKPEAAPVRAVFGLYFFHVAPLLGRLAGKGPEPYRWLAESLRRFPDRRGLEEMFARAGLSPVESAPLSMGAAAIHVGSVPAA